jgi:hypothetical protein
MMVVMVMDGSLLTLGLAQRTQSRVVEYDYRQIPRVSLRREW